MFQILPSYHLWYCCLTVHSYMYCEHITQCYNFWFTQLSFRAIQRKKKIKKHEFHNTLITFSTFFYFVYSSFHPVLYFFCLAELTLPLLVKWVCWQWILLGFCLRKYLSYIFEGNFHRALNSVLRNLIFFQHFEVINALFFFLLSWFLTRILLKFLSLFLYTPFFMSFSLSFVYNNLKMCWDILCLFYILVYILQKGSELHGSVVWCLKIT